MKEILLYTQIYNFTAAMFIKDMEAAKNSDIMVRLNCPGGDLFAAQGMFAKFQEHAKGKTVKVDGFAASGGAYFCTYADNAECLDVSKFLFHRAAMGSLEDEKALTPEQLGMVNALNSDLRKSLELKVGADRFAKVTGKTLDQMFSMDDRLDVWVNAQQAKEMGIVNKINPLTTQYKSEVMALSQQYLVAAFVDTTITNDTNTEVMNINEVKANTAIFDGLKTEILAKETDRVNSWLQFINVDAKAVSEGIKSGKDISNSETIAFIRKELATETAKAISASAPKAVAAGVVETEGEPKTPEALAAEASWAEVNKRLGIK